MSILCRIDDKHVPLYRVVWVSATPHFCGDEDCQREGSYEVRLEQDETVWANEAEQGVLLARLETWQGGLDATDGGNWE